MQCIIVLEQKKDYCCSTCHTSYNAFYLPFSPNPISIQRRTMALSLLYVVPFVKTSVQPVPFNTEVHQRVMRKYNVLQSRCHQPISYSSFHPLFPSHTPTFSHSLTLTSPPLQIGSRNPAPNASSSSSNTSTSPMPSKPTTAKKASRPLPSKTCTRSERSPS